MLDRSEAKALFEKNEGGYDWPFSREPAELKRMIEMIRRYEAGEQVEYETERERKLAVCTHGEVSFEPTARERESRAGESTAYSPLIPASRITLPHF